MEVLSQLSTKTHADYGGLISIFRILPIQKLPLSENPIVSRLSKDLSHLMHSYKQDREKTLRLHTPELKHKSPRKLFESLEEVFDHNQIGIENDNKPWSSHNIVGIFSTKSYQAVELSRDFDSIHSIIFRKNDYYVSVLRENTNWKLYMLNNKLDLISWSEVLLICTQLEVKPYMTFYKKQVEKLNRPSNSFFGQLECIERIKTSRNTTKMPLESYTAAKSFIRGSSSLSVKQPDKELKERGKLDKKSHKQKEVLINQQGNGYNFNTIKHKKRIRIYDILPNQFDIGSYLKNHTDTETKEISPTDASSENHYAETVWKCEVCLYRHNSTHLKICQECKCKRIESSSCEHSFPVRKLNAPLVDSCFNSSVDYREVIEMEWICSFCQYSNQACRYICDNCAKTDVDEFKRITSNDLYNR